MMRVMILYLLSYKIITIRVFFINEDMIYHTELNKIW